MTYDHAENLSSREAGIGPMEERRTTGEGVGVSEEEVSEEEAVQDSAGGGMGFLLGSLNPLRSCHERHLTYLWGHPMV